MADRAPVRSASSPPAPAGAACALAAPARMMRPMPMALVSDASRLPA
jgi:hypothetical protein